MKEFLDYLQSLVADGGPEPHQYDDLNDWFHRASSSVSSLTKAELTQLWDSFGRVFSMETLQGFSARKPYGYAGDFDIIERIYIRHASPDPELYRWDQFFHWQVACKAVCNRKTYFKDAMQHLQSVNPDARVLDVACGSCRDIYEFLQANPQSRLSFDCIDLDEKAIAFARKLVTAQQVNLWQGNAFHYTFRAKHYDIVWSAGLFDYLEDRHFRVLLKRLARAVKPGGELIIGNFTEPNQSRAYMEFGGWILIHRTASQLIELAAQAGMAHNEITIRQEPIGLNLFMHVRLP
ncbi:class I SAM-dependent methyltransferase [Pseudomonas sp. ML96]|uniref:class I SAM-dependent methyltransferase n=1 Tax=Pseudomonas sp. ML96 TaxID=1523503 RepID=UPI0005BAD727|nr:class I SAM-dependent methyltransferase [Pseudomonas sp. ML96]